VATLNVIRRWALRDQMSIREISRRTGLARNTIKKHLRSEESEPKYPRRVSSSKLDPYAEKLATWLVIEATKSRKQRRTLRQIHTDSAQKGENQELIHIVSTFCSQRVWVNIRWKTRVRLQRNSTIPPYSGCRPFSLATSPCLRKRRGLGVARLAIFSSSAGKKTVLKMSNSLARPLRNWPPGTVLPREHLALRCWPSG